MNLQYKCPYCHYVVSTDSESVESLHKYPIVCSRCKGEYFIYLKIKTRKRSQRKPKVKTDKQILMKYLDDLWSKIVKARAGYQCELTGQVDDLQSHHIVGKPTIYLRYLLEGGICIIAGKHAAVSNKFGQAKLIQAENEIKSTRGQDIFDKLIKMNKSNKSKADLKLIKIYLESEAQKYGILTLGA